MSDPTPSSSASRREMWLVAALLGIILAINFVTAVDYPHVWTDEVMYTDPAANLALGRGFTSTTWYAQSGDRFFAGNTPLHPLVLSEWIHLFGFSPFAVRAFNYVWFVLGTLLIWRFCQRVRWLENTWLRLLFIVLLACSSGFSFSYRSGRPDMIGYALLTLSLCAATIPRQAVRYACLLGVGFLLPWAGLQLLPLLLIATVLVLVFFGVRAGWNGILLGIGAGFGLLGLFCLYSSHGVWKDFLTSIGRHTTGSVAQYSRETRVFGLVELFMRDRSSPPLLLLAAVAAVRAFRANDRPALRILLFGLAAGIFIPLGLNFTGVFPIYYGWMAALPLALALFHVMAWRPFRSPWLKGAAGLLLAAAIGIGLPLRLLVTELQSNNRSYADVDKFVSQNLVATDHAYIDFAPYYPARRTAGKIFGIHYLNVITPEEKAAISVLVIDPDHFPGIASQIPGNWEPIAEFSSQNGPSRLPAFVSRRLQSQQTGVIYAPYHLVVYRKNNDHSQPLGQ